MISICIPVYNLNVAELVNALFIQKKRLDVASEIILIDDCSLDVFKAQNQQIESDINYIQLEKNVGRAAIRNLFLAYANYDHLLFLDCDSTIKHPDFLQNYVKAIKEYPDRVICGGSEYEKKVPPKNKRLRWKYGSKRESKPFEERKKDNYNSFLTNNFVINKYQFKNVRFDENLLNYGHEDTLFGIELKKADIKILHIDNAVCNGNLSENAEFVVNTEQAIQNLVFLLENYDHGEEIRKNIRLLRVYYQFHILRRIVTLMFPLFGPMIKNMLSKGYANLYLFDFYKLGFLNSKLET